MSQMLERCLVFSKIHVDPTAEIPADSKIGVHSESAANALSSQIQFAGDIRQNMPAHT